MTVAPAGGRTKTINFTIHGSNDAAVIGTPTVADVTADTPNAAALTLTAVGSITLTDYDTGVQPCHPPVTGVQGNLGTLVLAADGSYTYSVANAAVQFLAGTNAN